MKYSLVALKKYILLQVLYFIKDSLYNLKQCILSIITVIVQYEGFYDISELMHNVKGVVYCEGFYR